MDRTLLGIGLLLAVVLVLLLVRFALAWRRARGTRIVVCPETELEEAVEISAATALKTALKRQQSLRLSNCTRWPERQGCGQECLGQIEDSPNGCMVSELLRDWYAGKRCALCATEFGEINWHTHKPGLMNQERHMMRWSDVPAKQLHSVLEICSPLCWDCLVIESFIESNPDKVTYRPGAVVRGSDRGVYPSDH